jgi:hypothetical protein
MPVTTYVFSTATGDGNEVLTGAVDGSNTDFTPSHTIVASSIHAFINGVPISAALVGSVVRLIAAPALGDTVYVWGSSEEPASSGTGVSALTIMQDAATEIGVLAQGATLSTNNQSWILSKLNDLIGLWNAESLFIYFTDSTQYPIITSAASYTIGLSAADIIGSRPKDIKSAWWIDSSGSRTQLGIMDKYAFENMQDISSSASTPRNLYYKPTYPNGTIYLLPYPSTVGTIELFYDSELSSFSSVSTICPLPAGYKKALTLSLAEDICGSYGIDATGELKRKAHLARMIIQGSNIVIQKQSSDLPVSKYSSGGFMERY